MIHVPFDLVYKKLPNGRYAYYPFSPMWGWAYNVSAYERERLIDIDTRQMKLAGKLVAGLAIFIFWQNLPAFLISSFLSLVVLISSGTRQKKVVLNSRHLERCEPAFTYPEYWYLYASRVSGRDVLVTLRAFLVIAMVGGLMQYYGIENGQAIYLVVGSAFVLISLLGLTFGGYCAIIQVRLEHSKKNT